MLVPSKKIFYAVEAVLYIAYNAKAGPISGTDVAAAQNLPTRYLEPMMQKLVRAGILRGVRGPQGGYVLGRERRRISLADITNALGAGDTIPDNTTALGKEILRPQTEALTENWRGALADISIEQLCERAHAAGIPVSQDTTYNFMI